MSTSFDSNPNPCNLTSLIQHGKVEHLMFITNFTLYKFTTIFLRLSVLNAFPAVLEGTIFKIFRGSKTGRLLPPKDELIREELLEEAEFYQIHGILEELRHAANLPFKDSTILSTEHKQVFVNDWLKEKLKSGQSDFVLIYRASRDGWNSTDFHTHCDNKGPTVSVVKSGNYIFGGYTEQSWNGKRF